MLLAARKKLLSIELDTEEIRRFSKWVIQQYDTSEYTPFLQDIWEDVHRLIAEDEQTGIETFRYWAELLTEMEDIDFVIYCIKLRLVLLEKLFEDTHEVFIQAVKGMDQVRVKTEVFREIEDLLQRLEQEPDLSEVEKLRDRFDFLVSISKRIE